MTIATEVPNAEVEPTVPTTGELTQPKRPLSAYNYFFRSERARLVGVDLDLKEIADVHNRKKRRHRKTHGKMGFREMANKVGERWRTLSDDEKAPFIKMFEDDRTRYKNELKVWNELQKEKKKENLKREKEAARLAKAEEKKKKKLEKKMLDEQKKAANSSSAAVHAFDKELVKSDEDQEEADGMDDIINKALGILNGEDFSVVAATEGFRPSSASEEDATADYISRAMDMLSEDIPSDVPKQNRKRGRDSIDAETSKMLQNSMSLNTVMDFDRFLEEFDDERFVSDESSQGEDNEGESETKPEAHFTKKSIARQQGVGLSDMFDDVLLDGIEPVSVSQMHTSLNALESDLNNIGREGWANYGSMMHMHQQIPMQMMHLQSGKTGLIPDIEGNLGFGTGFGQGFNSAFNSAQYQNLLSFNSRTG